MKQRIWELDALRGICILGMLVVHLVYDAVELFHIVHWNYPAAFLFIKQWGGILFLLISGTCVTLGSRCVRRGLFVFACGLLCTAVTLGLSALNDGAFMVIWFGVLHCLGLCMLLWPLFRKLPVGVLAALGISMAAFGLWLDGKLLVDFPWLAFLGFQSPGFVSSDYFPLFPHLGFFLLGAVLGRTLYRSRKTLLPRVDPANPVIRFLCGCGRHSLWIYLLHQPVFSAVLYLTAQFLS